MAAGRMRILGAALLVLVGYLGPFVLGQEDIVQDEKTDPRKVKIEEFWFVRQRADATAAALVVFESNHLMKYWVAESYQKNLGVWPQLGFVGDTAPPLNPRWLPDIKDNTPMPRIGHLGPDIRKDQEAIYMAFTDAILKASRTPLDAFEKSAKENAGVTIAHLLNNPSRYRGEVIPIEGRLKRVRVFDAPLAARKAGYVLPVYEGWVFGPTRKSTPFWIVFLDMPEGVKEAEEMDLNVVFYGYFLKNLGYKGSDKDNKNLVTPFLVGPSIIRSKPVLPVEPPETPFSLTMLLLPMGIIAAVFVGLLFLSWYFKRGDQELHRKLANMQAERALEMVEQAERGALEPSPAPTADVPLAKPVEHNGVVTDIENKDNKPE